MYDLNTPRLRKLAGRFLAAVATFALAHTAPAVADQIQDHNEQVARFIIDRQANPLVADCAAHGAFVATTSAGIEHVDFGPDAFAPENASVTPWNDSFGDRKQRVKVDTVVTVNGQGVRQGGDEPLSLKFRCGYVDEQLFAFSWNDPSPPAVAAKARASLSRAVHGKKRRGAAH